MFSLLLGTPKLILRTLIWVTWIVSLMWFFWTHHWRSIVTGLVSYQINHSGHGMMWVSTGFTDTLYQLRIKHFTFLYSDLNSTKWTGYFTTHTIVSVFFEAVCPGIGPTLLKIDPRFFFFFNNDAFSCFRLIRQWVRCKNFPNLTRNFEIGANSKKQGCVAITCNFFYNNICNQGCAFQNFAKFWGVKLWIMGLYLKYWLPVHTKMIHTKWVGIFRFKGTPSSKTNPGFCT